MQSKKVLRSIIEILSFVMIVVDLKEILEGYHDYQKTLLGAGEQLFYI